MRSPWMTTEGGRGERRFSAEGTRTGVGALGDGAGEFLRERWSASFFLSALLTSDDSLLVRRPSRLSLLLLDARTLASLEMCS